MGAQKRASHEGITIGGLSSSVEPNLGCGERFGSPVTLELQWPHEMRRDRAKRASVSHGSERGALDAPS